MTESLGEAWIKKFDAATASVASDGPRLLHIDGHCSHVNVPLLDYAVAANIIVFGYPPHTTHLLQGLDVVLFSPFKHAFAKHAAEHLSATGRDVDKCDFLEVLHHSVEDSFTKDNILTAWRKTGLRPVDPTVIADKDLAASKPFSITHHNPLEPPSPIKPLIAAIQGQLQLQAFRLAADRAAPKPLDPSPQVTPSLEPPELVPDAPTALSNGQFCLCFFL
jgi:DDE superfamily endonuclease